MDALNNFNGGQESDLSKQIHKPNTYLQALNFRPINEINSSTGSLVNIKGNECKVTFPELQNVYKLIITDGSDDPSTNTITFTINGVISANTLTISNTTTGLEIYNHIIANFTECYQNTTVITKTFSIAYEDNYVVIYQIPEYTDCGPSVPSVPITIEIDYDDVTDGTLATLLFVNKGVANSLTQDDTNPYVLGTVDSVAIGSTFILNDIYILTAPDNVLYGPAGITNEIPSNDEFGYSGAIWRLNIDDITKVHTLTLLYNNNLDLTKYHPIPPSAISGRYESMDIKRIYWSDNYNKIRVLNTETPQLMALNPTQLSVMPSVEFTQPILGSIGTGVLPAGCYQLAYRLSKVLGSVTNYSELSNPVYLTYNSAGESAAFYVYEGATGTTSESIIWNLDNLDTNYDQIEFIVSYRSSESAVPVLRSPGPQPLSETMTFEYADPAASVNSEVTLEEFLLFNGTFTHAKTCDTKDNRLFWGNVRAPRKELEIYDARAFRANDAGDILLTNSGTNSAYDITTAAALAQTEDTINEYYDSATGDYSTNACYLKPSTATTTKILGGEGVNISYEFGTRTIQIDNNAAISDSEGWNLENAHVGSPYRGSSTEASPIQLIYNYPQNNKYAALKQPERTSLLRGFQHEEIYRFGIQFFDKQGNPYFTKWIGDIKMPSYGDTNSNPANPGITDFRLTFQGASNDIQAQILCVIFTVNVDSIKDLIGGYQIVRTKRDASNKTIWGVGMVNPMMSIDGASLGATATLPAGWRSENAIFTLPGPILQTKPYYKPYPSQESVETLNINDDDGSNGTFASFKTFDCFDFDVNLRPTFGSNDRLLIRSRLESINYRNGAGGYRQWFGRDRDFNGNFYPGNTTPINSGTGPLFFSATGSNNDNSHQPFFLIKTVDNALYCNYGDFVTSGTNNHNYILTHTEYIAGNDVSNYSGYSINNKGLDAPIAPAPSTGSPCGGKQTLFTVMGGNVSGSKSNLFTSGTYGCRADTIPFYKLLALYYKPNNSLYGGATYANRSENTYIPCGEYVTIIQDELTINVPSLTFQVYGGDTFTTMYDMQKTFKPLSGGAEYWRFTYNNLGIYQSLDPAEARFGTSFFIPCTGFRNQELRLGNHPNRDITNEAGYEEDQYLIETYTNAENDTKTYYPKPLNFQTSDEWINRVYFSEIKFNNEPQDSWSEYLTDHFYDVEGNYGGINALISLKENMYYIQERGLGLLMINPVSMVNDQLGQPIKLGASNDVIQKHYYKAIDVGTVHQWSVYRSQSAITFVDARHKKIYLFNGESVTPISDVKGQRSFVIKRLHNELLKYDNPVINKGILVTYDYYHNEFLYTFNNVLTEDTVNNENLTLAYSEVMDNFTGLYSFTPNLYINSNKYLLSTKHPLVTDTNNKLWFHNYGTYGMFYNTLCKSNLKLLINDKPLYTKVFDNITWNSESIKDNVEWNDDYNLYPGSPTNPLYVDDVNNQSDTFNRIRCYNDWQNSDWNTLTLTPPNNNLTRKERNFNLQVPRNKFDYDSTSPSILSIFNPANLTKIYFGERMRDKYMIVDLEYPNTTGNRFIIHNLKTIYRISDR